MISKASSFLYVKGRPSNKLFSWKRCLYVYVALCSVVGSCKISITNLHSCVYSAKEDEIMGKMRSISMKGQRSSLGCKTWRQEIKEASPREDIQTGSLKRVEHSQLNNWTYRCEKLKDMGTANMIALMPDGKRRVVRDTRLASVSTRSALMNKKKRRRKSLLKRLCKQRVSRCCPLRPSQAAWGHHQEEEPYPHVPVKTKRALWLRTVALSCNGYVL